MPDTEAAERDYFARTGFYPLNHAVVIHNDVLAAFHNPVRDHVLGHQTAFCQREVAIFGAFLLVLVISGPPVLISMIVGLIIALFQALTQIQEQSLTFVPKIIVIFVATLIMLPFMLATLTTFTEQIMDRIVSQIISTAAWSP